MRLQKVDRGMWVSGEKIIQENISEGPRDFLYWGLGKESFSHFSEGKTVQEGKGVEPEPSFPINPFLFLPDHVTRLAWLAGLSNDSWWQILTG